MSDTYLKPDWEEAQLRSIRDGVGEGLVKIGEDKRVVVLSGDLAESTRAGKFYEVYPERFFEMGVQEQNMVGVASGMASEGLVPFAVSYASFSPGRSYEQVRVSVCLSNLGVKLIGSHGGVATGVNGPTHQATEDIALMRVLPNMTVLVPADATQAREATVAAFSYPGPVYIRTARPATPDFTKEQAFEVGKTYRYREGRDATIVACGTMVYECLTVAQGLHNRGIECEVLNVSTIKPLDKETILKSVAKTRKVVSVEDHQVVGGLGGAVAELLSEELPARLKRIGIQDRFGVSGDWEQVYEKMGLDRAWITEVIRQFVLS